MTKAKSSNSLDYIDRCSYDLRAASRNSSEIRQKTPRDTVGIVTYAVTFVAFALAAIGFFIRWNK